MSDEKNDNVFDFEAWKKAFEELSKQKEEQAKKETTQEDFTKILEVFGSLFKPPSQEEMNKATAQFADSLENAAKVIRAMQSATEKKDGKDGEGE
tara:strand:- start:185 stop:469 length:285 start_codon:yes stop_codon:yes gene_type:complete